MKDLIFVKEKTIKGEEHYRMINWLTEDQVAQVTWALDYEDFTIVEKEAEEKKQR
jgi:hypothetical protein